MLSRTAEALALVQHAPTHKTAGVCLATWRAIADVAGIARDGLPTPVAAHLDHVAHHDPARGVWVSAAVALEAARTPAGGAWTDRLPHA